MSTHCTDKERPILFSADMVNAILSGRKTQTRQVMKPQPPHHEWNAFKSSRCQTLIDGVYFNCPYGKVGDRLWVRETFSTMGDADRHALPIFYRADGDQGHGCWTPSIHMPRWASRIALEITGVRVERLNQITPHDCIAEGIDVGDFADIQHDCANGISVVDRFIELWQAINGADSWQANPWVWVIEFERVQP